MLVQRALAIGLLVLCTTAAYPDTAPSVPQEGRGAGDPGLADLHISESDVVPREAFERYIRRVHRDIDPVYLRTVFLAYADATATEGVSLVVALAQMIHETDYLRFTGAVHPTQYNFSGIGSTGPGIPGDRFQDVATGVLAHVQHLRAYADSEPLVRELVDPRFFLVTRGSAKTVRALTGRWATDPLYGEKVLAHAHRLLETARWYGKALPRTR